MKKVAFKPPTQARSKERVELILKTAKQLIGDRGVDDVSMREIADTCGIQIGSLYQYFPNKNILLLTIMREYYEAMFSQTSDLFSSATSLSDFRAKGEIAIMKFIEMFEKDTALNHLWSGARAIPELIREDNLDSYRNADLIIRTALKFFKGLTIKEIKPFALHMAHTTGAILRFIKELPKEDQKAMVQEYILQYHLRFDALVLLSKEKMRKSKKS
ncbi:transcriptional regulator, TetR family [Leptospira ryugenii]|uniref:Transcriptional regulator, TetR family n=2 Tax=Leptospira ryugenii TaxID=1917863 RepID=A0A2P2E0G4_9LEPT|nr:transcriptional regulator, TetR family [Leptospira ryugenii]